MTEQDAGAREAKDRVARLRRTVSVVVADCSSGTPFLVGIITVVVCLVASVSVDYSRSPPGWAEPLNTMQSLVFLLVPLGLGAAATHVALRSRAGALNYARTTPAGERGALFVMAGACAAWLLLALVVSLVVQVLRADVDGPLTWRMLLLPLNAVVVVVAAVTVGVAVGRLVPSSWTGPASTTVGFAAMVGVQLLQDYDFGAANHPAAPLLRWLQLPYNDIFYSIDREPRAGFVALQALGCIAVAVLAAATTAIGRRAHIWAAAGVALLLVTVAAATQVTASPTRQRAAPDPVCRSDAEVRLCVWPGLEHLLEPAVASLSRAHAAAQPLFDTADTFTMTGLTVAGAPFPVLAGADPWLLETSAASAVVPGALCELDDDAAFFARRELVMLVQVRAGTAGPAVSETVLDVARRPVEEQRAWAQDQLQMFASCDVG